MKTIKATRYELIIADFPINAYLLPDGKTVKLSGRGVMSVGTNLGKLSLPQFYGVKTLKALPHADASLPPN